MLRNPVCQDGPRPFVTCGVMIAMTSDSCMRRFLHAQARSRGSPRRVGPHAPHVCVVAPRRRGTAVLRKVGVRTLHGWTNRGRCSQPTTQYAWQWRKSDMQAGFAATIISPTWPHSPTHGTQEDHRNRIRSAQFPFASPFLQRSFAAHGAETSLGSVILHTRLGVFSSVVSVKQARGRHVASRRYEA